MRKLFFALFLLPALAFGQNTTYDTTIAGWPAIITRDVNHWQLDSVQAIIFFPGIGELGTDVNKLRLYGPHYWMLNGWDGGVDLGNGRHYPLIISLLPPSSGTTAALTVPKLSAIYTKFKIKRGQMHLTGLSAGGQFSNKSAAYKATTTDFAQATMIGSICAVQGQDPFSSSAGSAPAAPQRFGHWAKNRERIWGKPGREWYLKNLTDVDFNSTSLIQNIDDSAGSTAGLRTVTALSGGTGHCCWNEVYDPAATNWTSSSGKYNSGDQVNMSVYQWMLRNGDTTLSGTPVITPTVNAGTDKTITLPTSSVTMTGSVSVSSGTVTSSWTKIAGPSTFTITTPSSPTTTITGLVEGVYTFRLTGNTPSGGSAQDDVDVTVNPAPGACTANAGPDQVFDLGAGVLNLDGTGSTGATGWTWRVVTTRDADWKYNLKRGDSAKAQLVTAPYISSAGVNVELTVTGAGGCNSKDTVNVKATWGSINTPQNLGSGWRYATSADLPTDPKISVGDLLLEGANFTTEDGQGRDIRILTGSGINLGPGKKILIKGGVYRFINLPWTAAVIAGTKADPVVITNYGGQVECQAFFVSNLSGAKITGRYVPGVSGDVNFQGHANNNYAFSRGKYGIFCNGKWLSLANYGMKIVGDNTDSVEVEYVEIGNGNFAGMQIKEEGSDVEYDAINVHDNFIHDTHAEGIYFSSTGGDPQNNIRNCRIENNRIVNTGSEAIQIMRGTTNNYIRNNVVINSASNEKSPFGGSQANSIQMGFFNGNNGYENNIDLGTGQSMYNFFTSTRVSETPNGDTIYIRNNLSKWGRGATGAYGGPDGGAGIPGVATVIDRNYFGGFEFWGDSIYTSTNAVNTQTIWKFATSNTYLLRNNTIDGTKTTLFTGATGSATGTVTAAIEDPLFIQSGWAQNQNWNRMMEYADSVYKVWGDEGAPGGVQIGKPIRYALGDTVLFQSKWYTSKKNGNQGVFPTGATDDNWTLLTWSGYAYPPEDLRLQSGSKYHLRGMGLAYDASPLNGPAIKSRAIRKIVVLN